MKRLIAILSIIFLLITPSNVYGYSTNMNGIDISNNNGSVDFNTIKNNGVIYCYIKATEGIDYKDNKFIVNYQNAKSQGLKVGSYHFMSPYTDPVQQAHDYYNCISPYLSSMDLIPCLDVETTNGRTAKDITNRVISFLEEFKRLSGIDCIIYTYTSFAYSNLEYNRLSCYKLWVANYSGYYNNTYVPASWISNVVGWQFTENKYIGGKRFDANDFSTSILRDGTSSIVVTSNSNSVLANWSWKNWVYKLQGTVGCYKDGITGPITLSKCPTLRYGATGESVKRLQEVLQASGYWDCIPDGIFGEYTAKCVIDFQYRHGISVDGIAGKQTWRSILGI